MIFLLFISGILFAGLVIVHLIICRLTGSDRYVAKSLLLNIVFIILSAYFLILKVGIIDSFLIYLGLIILWNSYLVLFINLQNSISFRILLTIFDSTKQKLNYSEIEKEYSDEISLRDRLSSMEINQFIRLASEKITIEENGMSFAKAFLLFRKIFGIKKFG